MDQPPDPQQTQQSNPTPGPPSVYSRRDRSNSPRRTTRYSPPRDSYPSRGLISRVPPPRSPSPHPTYPSHRDDRGYPRDDNRGYSHHRDDRGYDRGGYRDEPPRSAYRDDRRGMYEGRGGYAADRDRGGYDRSSGGGYPSGPAYSSGSAPRGGYGGGPGRGSGTAGSAGRGRRPVDRGSDTDRRDSTTIYVGNLPYSFRERDVADLFERYGRLRKVTVLMDNYTSRNKGFAFVEFEDRRDAEDAFDMYSGFSVEGRRLKLDWDIGMVKKDAHRGRGSSDYQPPPPPPPGPTASSDPYVRDAPPPPRGYSPNYRAGGRSPSPYRR